MKLNEWTKHFIKFKDCMKKHIKDMTIETDRIITTEKIKNKTYLINEDLEQGTRLLNTAKTETVFVVCLNTKNNVNYLFKQWKRLSEHKDFTVVFANPKSNENWTIHLQTHNAIIEPETLEQGLQSLYKSINPAD